MQTDHLRRGRALGHRIWPWLLFALLAVTAQSAAHLGNEFLLDGRYRSLDAAVDASVFGRANSLVIGLSAVLVALAARQTTRRAPRLLLSACLLIVMADDATGLHDRLDLSARKAMLGLAFACLLALTAWLLLREAALATRAPRVLLVLGLAALASAVAVRVIEEASAVGAGLDATEKALGVAAEQGLDFAGWVLVATGLYALLAERKEDELGRRSYFQRPTEAASATASRRGF